MDGCDILHQLKTVVNIPLFIAGWGFQPTPLKNGARKCWDDYSIPNCETGKSNQFPWFQSPPTSYDIPFIMVIYIYISLLNSIKSLWKVIKMFQSPPTIYRVSTIRLVLSAPQIDQQIGNLETNHIRSIVASPQKKWSYTLW